MAHRTFTVGEVYGTSSTAVNEKNEIIKINDNEIDRIAELLMKEYGTIKLNTEQLQKVLNIGETALYRLLEKDILPSEKNGNRYLVSVYDAAKFKL